MDIDYAPTNNDLVVPIGDAAADSAPETGTPSLLEEKSKPSKLIRPIRQCLKALLTILSYSYLSPFLIFSPIAIAAHLAPFNLYTSFSLNLLALIPYAAFIATITEELAEKTSPVIGASINVSLGNTPEFIVLIIALRKGEMEVVQAAVIGSILVNNLLVAGISLFIGGLYHRKQAYDKYVAQKLSGALTFAGTVLLLVTTFQHAYAEFQTGRSQVIKLSRATSIVELFVYAALITWFLINNKTGLDHDIEAQMFRVITGHQPRAGMARLFRGLSHAERVFASRELPGNVSARPTESTSVVPLASDRTHGPMFRQRPPILYRCSSSRTYSLRSLPKKAKHFHSKARPLSLWLLIGLLLACSVLVAVHAEFLVDALKSMADAQGLPKFFVGLIVLPIASNAAEHFTSIKLAYKNKMDAALNIAIGSSVQIVFLISPLIVLIGWGIGQDVTLSYELVEVASTLASIFVVALLLQSGASSFLEGALLTMLYVILGVAAWLHPSKSELARAMVSCHQGFGGVLEGGNSVKLGVADLCTEGS